MAEHQNIDSEHDARMVHRLLFFSDAVFAIVLTLLAIELHPPEMEDANRELWPALAHMLAQFGPFAMSFALIGLWWSIHMRQLRRLIHFDWLVAITNLLALAFITLIPFATSVFGENINSINALQFYWWISLGVSASMTLLFLALTRGKGRLVGGIGVAEWWSRFILSLAPGIAFASGIYFCAANMALPAEFAFAIMFPIMAMARLIYRAPKPAKS